MKLKASFSSMHFLNPIGFLATLCICMMLTSCSAEIENYALMLKGDWPEHCTQEAIIPRNYDYYLGQVEVEEEVCVTYEYPVGDFVLHAKTIWEDELRFWLEDPFGELVQLNISSNHPCDGDYDHKTLYTYLYGVSGKGLWSEPDQASVSGTPSAVVLLRGTWLTNEKQEQLVEERQLHPDPKERYFCYQRPAANPITVLLTAEEHDFRVEVPVAVWHNGYTVAVVAI